MPTVEELGRKVKAKHQGYDDMSDAEVGTRVKAKFPGTYDDFTGSEAAVRWGDPQKSEDPGFWATLGEAAKNGPRALMDFITGHPYAQLKQRGQEMNAASTEAFKKGDYSTGIGLGLAAIIPGSGDEALAAGEEFGAGHPGAGAAHAVLALAPFLARPTATAASRAARTAAPAARTTSSFVRGAVKSVPSVAGENLTSIHLLKPGTFIKPAIQTVKAGIERVRADRVAATRAEQLARPVYIPERVRAASEAIERARAAENPDAAAFEEMAGRYKTADGSRQAVYADLPEHLQEFVRNQVSAERKAASPAPPAFPSGRVPGTGIAREQPTAASTHEPLPPQDLATSATEQWRADWAARQAAEADTAVQVAEASRVARAEAALLDDLALGFGEKKPFAKLSKEHQDAIRRIADAMRRGNVDEPPAQPAVPRPPGYYGEATEQLLPEPTAPAIQEPVTASAPQTPAAIAAALRAEMEASGTLPPLDLPARTGANVLTSEMQGVPASKMEEVAKATSRQIIRETEETGVPRDAKTEHAVWEARGRMKKVEPVLADLIDRGHTAAKLRRTASAKVVELVSDAAKRTGQHELSLDSINHLIAEMERLEKGAK